MRAEHLGTNYKERNYRSIVRTQIKSCFGRVAMTYNNSAALDVVVFDQPEFSLSKLN